MQSGNPIMEVLTLLLLVVAAHGRVMTEDSASYFNKSLFLEIIPTEDLRIRDPIYVTPGVIFIGNDNGDILRCLEEEPNECEVYSYSKGRSCVYALLVTGEYLYAGLNSGVILRCDLYKVDSCTTFYSGSSAILSLLAAEGYLFASQHDPPSILRCDFNQPNSCRPFHKIDSSYLWAISHYGKYIYVGLDDGTVLRCSIKADSSCTHMYHLSSRVQDLANVGNNIYAVTTNEKSIRNCSLKSDDTINTCLPMSVPISSPRNIAAFKGNFYVVDSDGLHICKCTNNTCSSCNLYSKWYIESIAIAYKTYQMQNRYRNEQMACTWQSNNKCPPFVTYYDPQERDMFAVHVKDGRLYNSQGYLVDTSNANVGQSGPAAIFVMGPDGRLLLSNAHVKELLHTSSLLAGNPVAGAGEIVVSNGVIVSITACAKHYQPDVDLNRQVVTSLRTQGYTEPINLKKCGEFDEYEQIESNNWP